MMKIEQAPSNQIDEPGIRAHRLSRVRQLLAEHDLAGIVLIDPVNLRYATGTRNMQVWTMHNLCRYAFIATSGPVVLFDGGSSAHLSQGVETIDEVRTGLSFDYMQVGGRGEELARRWAADLAELVREHGGGNQRLAIDRADLLGVRALDAAGVELTDGKVILERARAIKSAEEIRAYRLSLLACDESVAVMREATKPGMRESEALAALIGANVARGGEYPETRLLTTGPRTNPWFQETGDRIIEEGDLLSFDTDLIGPMGFYTDISRSWVIGDVAPNDDQRRLYDLARQQLEHNTALLRPGVGFLEYAQSTFVLPDAYLANRYADVAHGCGLGVEYPFIWYPEDAQYGAYDGVFEENMIVCVEAYIGALGGREGVKLEQPLLITEQGPQLLSTYPLEDDFG